MTAPASPPVAVGVDVERRIPLTSASEVFDLMDGTDPIDRILKASGVDDSTRITVAYALIADRKDRALASPVSGEGSSLRDTHRDPAPPVVAHSVYLSAVGGRMAFRDAYRRCLPVVQAAEALAAKWTREGQKVDSDDFYAAIHDVCEAAIKRNGEHEATDRALAAASRSPGMETLQASECTKHGEGDQ